MNEWELSKEQVVADLKKIIDLINDGTFEGVLVFRNSQQQRGFLIAEKGCADDRIDAIDAIFRSVYKEPNLEGRRYLMAEMFKRWLHIFPDISFIPPKRRSVGDGRTSGIY